MKRKRTRQPVDMAAELAKMPAHQRMELLMAIEEINHYLAIAPTGNLPVTAERMFMASRLRGVNLSVQAFEQAVRWLDARRGSK